MMSEAEKANLIRSMQDDGYDATMPIVLHEGLILDGRNRYDAAQAAGVEPVFTTYEGTDPLAFVIRHNLHRRNLNAGQLALIAEEIALLPKGGDGRNQYSEGCSEPSNPLTQNEAAKLVGASRTSTQAARKIKQEAPELIPLIASGEMLMEHAIKEVKKKKFEEKKAEFIQEIKPKNIDQIIIHGDCTVEIPKLENKFDLLLSDPPYGMDFKSGWSDKNKIANDELVDTIKLFESMLAVAVGKLKHDAHFYLFGNIDYVEQIRPIIEKHLTLKNILIWDRSVIGMGDLKTYGKSYDIIYFGYNKVWKDLNGVRDRDILSFSRVDPNKNIHPTEKPTDLLEFLIKKSTKENDMILEPFAGGGSTLVAAKNTNRKCVGIELESEYVNLIKSRI